MARSRSSLYPLPLDLSATSDTAEHSLLNGTLSFGFSDTFCLTGHFCGSALLAPPLVGLETSVSGASDTDSCSPSLGTLISPLAFKTICASRWCPKMSLQPDLQIRLTTICRTSVLVSPRHISDPRADWDSWSPTSSSLAPPLVFPISVSAPPLPSVVQLENPAISLIIVNINGLNTIEMQNLSN